VHGWLRTCLKHHKVCGSYLSSQPLPARVLEIRPEDGSLSVRLHVTNGRSGLYAALSYRWGNSANQFKTTKANYESMLRNIDIASLPVTIADAVKFCKALGICYLWVDALCIIQDDGLDWADESAKVGTTYGQAALTLSASLASDSGQGFLDSSHVGPSINIPWRDPSTQRCGSLYIRHKVDTFYDLFSRKSPLTSRGWTLQERLLSPRVLHFGQQMYWECWGAMFSEDGRFDTYLRGLPSNPNRTELGRSEIRPWWERPPHHEIKGRWMTFEYWSKVVEGFTQRSLTDPMDKLPALAGLANVLTQSNGDVYYAGLWKSSLDLDLLWRRRVSAYMESPPRYRAPSWSWAALDGPISSWNRTQYLATEFVHEIQVEMDLHDICDGMQVAGSIEKSAIGFLDVSAPLNRARPVENLEEFSLNDPEIEGWVKKGFNFHILKTDGNPRNHYWICVFDRQPDLLSKQYFLLRINFEVACMPKGQTQRLLGLKHWALILEEDAIHTVRPGAACYRRVGIGWLSINPEDIGGFLGVRRGGTLPSPLSWGAHSADQWGIHRVIVV
jgi:hypothetical protein